MNSDAHASPPSFGADFDPLSVAYLADPYPFLTEAREAAPAFYCDAIGHWIVTRYQDIRHLLRTPALFSATNINAPLHPPCPMAAKALADGGFRAVPALNTDPPAHTRVRKLANIAFTPKRVAEMEGFVRDLVIRFCTERLRDGRADMVRDLAWELPALVLFRILGVPDDEVPRVKSLPV
jgi:cytochrome P450